MNNVKEIQLPKGWEVDKVENGKIVLKENKNLIDKLPNSWKECAYNITHDIIKEDFIFFQTINSSKYKEAFEALSKLIILRDCYRMGWKPNYINNKDKSGMFAFQSQEIRDKFYNNFKDLLEQIRPFYE